MYKKMLFIVAGLAVIGLTLLALRRQQLSMRHEMTRLHGRINDTRKRVWGVQTKIAQRSTPEALRQAVDKAGLELEPVTRFDIAHPQTWPGVGQSFVRR